MTFDYTLVAYIYDDSFTDEIHISSYLVRDNLTKQLYLLTEDKFIRLLLENKLYVYTKLKDYLLDMGITQKSQKKIRKKYIGISSINYELIRYGKANIFTLQECGMTKTFLVNIFGNEVRIVLDRLKDYFGMAELLSYSLVNCNYVQAEVYLDYDELQYYSFRHRVLYEIDNLIYSKHKSDTLNTKAQFLYNKNQELLDVLNIGR